MRKIVEGGFVGLGRRRRGWSPSSPVANQIQPRILLAQFPVPERLHGKAIDTPKHRELRSGEHPTYHNGVRHLDLQFVNSINSTFAVFQMAMVSPRVVCILLPPNCFRGAVSPVQKFYSANSRLRVIPTAT